MASSHQLGEDEDSSLDLVQLDGAVVLKIINHCKDNLPELVTGQLLGLDIGSTLEVTNCFPFPSRLVDENEEGEEGVDSAEYQIDMMKCLREVNVDHNTVGWYSSTYMGSFINESAIETQYNYQDRIKKSVVLVYDPLKTSQGALSLKAYRLTQSFMELYKSQSFTKESLAKANVTFNEVFEEIPIKIANSGLARAFLQELEETGSVDYEFERLNLSTNPFLEKNLEFLIECLDDLGAEQSKLQYHQRNVHKLEANKAAWLAKRRLENTQRKLNGEEPLPEDDPQLFKAIAEPSRLESILITNQVNNYCKQIKHFAGNSMAKLWLVGSGIQKDS